MSNNKCRKPCKGCPFRRENSNDKPNPGGSTPMVYLGQTRGPFWLPCHASKGYKSKGNQIDEIPQCAGAAIFRANCETTRTPKQLLSLPKDTENVFANEREFLKYYYEDNISESQLDWYTKPEVLEGFMVHEMIKQSSSRREFTEEEINNLNLK